MENEPPAHTRLRRLVAGAFARGHVERMRPRIEAVADELLDDLAPAGAVDVAGPVRRAVAGRGDRRAAGRAGAPTACCCGTGRRRSCGCTSTAATSDRVEAAAARRRRSPRTSASCRSSAARSPATTCSPTWSPTRDGAARLSDDELVASVVLLLNAGHEASVNAFGNGLVALLPHRDELARMTSGDVPGDGARGAAPPRRPAAAVRAHRHRRPRARRRPVRRARRSPRCWARRTATRPCSRMPDARRRPRPEPARRLRDGRALLPRRAAGADGARDHVPAVARPLARPGAGRDPVGAARRSCCGAYREIHGADLEKP